MGWLKASYECLALDNIGWSGSSVVWLARDVRDVEVVGSNPTFPTILSITNFVGSLFVQSLRLGGVERRSVIILKKWFGLILIK